MPDETPLKRYMIGHRVTIISLAARLALDRAYVSGIVNGWATPGAIKRWAPHIAAALGVPLADIFPDLKEEP